MAALYGIEMSSMMFVAKRSRFEAVAAPKHSAADSRATSMRPDAVMVRCALSRLLSDSATCVQGKTIAFKRVEKSALRGHNEQASCAVKADDLT